jgi:fucose 4-O-acetylase-like acetyltransferase
MLFALIFRGDIDLILPYWHLWYLLALSLWCLIGAGFNCLPKKLAITAIALTFALGCAVGFADGIDRTLSLSRVIVFLPYFLIGIMMPKARKEKGRIRRGSLFLISGLALYFIFKSVIPVFFMNQAEPYGDLGFRGVMLRCICYAIGILIILGIYYLSPNKRLPITKIGADTLMIYILHGPIVGWIRRFSDNASYIAVSFILSAVIIYILHRIFIFSGKLYAVREKGEGAHDGTVS